MSTLRVNTVTDSAGSGNPDVGIDTSGIAKAWVHFSGTGTVEVFAAFNVSAITDNSTGDFTVNFTTAFPDTLYASLFSVGGSATIFKSRNKTGGSSASAINIETENDSDAKADAPNVYVAVFR